MNNRAEMGFDGAQAVRSRGGWRFMAGVLVGLTGALAGLTLAVAAQRRQRRQNTTNLASPSGSAQESAEWQAEQSQLDEELAQTFPASDPLPQSHRVD